MEHQSDDRFFLQTGSERIVSFLDPQIEKADSTSDMPCSMSKKALFRIKIFCMEVRVVINQVTYNYYFLLETAKQTGWVTREKILQFNPQRLEEEFFIKLCQRVQDVNTDQDSQILPEEHFHRCTHTYASACFEIFVQIRHNVKNRNIQKHAASDGKYVTIARTGGKIAADDPNHQSNVTSGRRHEVTESSSSGSHAGADEDGIVTQFMGYFFKEDRDRDRKASQVGITQSCTQGQAIDQIVDPVADDHHPCQVILSLLISNHVIRLQRHACHRIRHPLHLVVCFFSSRIVLFFPAAAAASPLLPLLLFQLLPPARTRHFDPNLSD